MTPPEELLASFQAALADPDRFDRCLDGLGIEDADGEPVAAARVIEALADPWEPDEEGEAVLEAAGDHLPPFVIRELARALSAEVPDPGRVSELIEFGGTGLPADLGPTLVELLARDDIEWHELAARGLGLLVVDELPTMLAGPIREKAVTWACLEGLIEGLEDGNGGTGCREALFTLFDGWIEEDAVELGLFDPGPLVLAMFEIDPVRTKERLDPERVRALSDEAAAKVVEAFTMHGLGMDPEVLRELLHRDGSPEQELFACALFNLHLSEPDQATGFARQVVERNDKNRLEAAGELMLEDLGLGNLRNRVLAKAMTLGFDALSAIEQDYLAVALFEHVTRQGGLGQYFLDSASDHWPLALRGLRAAGLEPVAALLEEATSVFGEEGPSTDLELRQAQLEAAIEEAPARLADIGQRLGELGVPIVGRLHLYAMARSTAFTLPDEEG